MHQVIVIGSGFSGICLGIKLRAAGITDFKILEKAEELGGTWRENTYPGAECDIPSALYSFSFEHNPTWNYKWSGQEQILKYQQDTAAKYQVLQHMVFSQTVTQCTFDDAQSYWTVETAEGETYTTRHLVTAVGQLHLPNVPKFTGQFDGVSFHSARWDHSFDLNGKRVAVIGNAASALQFIPEIAKQAADVYVFQRSANWVLPKVDRPYAKWEQWLSDRVPVITKLYRFSLWFQGEAGPYSAIKGNRLMQWLLRLWNQSYLKKHIKSPELRKQLTPDYPIGAKRILFSDHYYDEFEVDAVIYGTGFITNPFLSQIKVIGKGGLALSDHWSEGAHAYLGLSTHGFPNLHFMYGPNTNLGHNSIIIMIEAQAKAIVKLVQRERVEIAKIAEQAFNDEMQRRLNSLAFSTVADSWYKVGERITNNWAGRTTEYRRRVKNLDEDLYST